jgi:hypothetical protein
MVHLYSRYEAFYATTTALSFCDQPANQGGHMDARIGDQEAVVFQFEYTPEQGTGDPDAPCAFLVLSQQALAQQCIDSTHLCCRCARVVGVHSAKRRLCTWEHDALKSAVDLEQQLDTLTYAVRRDWLLLRLARMHGLPDEEKRKRCLEHLDQLHGLLTQMKASLTDT